MIIALPKELSQSENIALIRQYCNEQFVDKGMCCDFTVHDKGDGNPHAHLLLTMRGLDANGKWMPKSKSEYVLDENGERIRQKSGRWKMRKVNTVDWNDRDKAEVWRHEWEVIQNRYLEQANVPERISMKSFERQGITNFAPTVHLGAAATRLERKGIRTMLGDLNRDIQAFNRVMQSIKDRLKWLVEQTEKIGAAIEELKTAPPPTIIELLNENYEQRNDARQDFKVSAVRKLQLTVDDWNRLESAKQLMRNNHIDTPEQLKAMLEKLLQGVENIHHNVKIRKILIGEADAAREYLENFDGRRAIFDKYNSMRYKGQKERFYQKNKRIIDDCITAERFIREHPELKTTRDIVVQRGKWQKENNGADAKVQRVQEVADQCKRIVRWVNGVLPEDEKIVCKPAEKTKRKTILPEIDIEKGEKRSVHNNMQEKKQEVRQKEERNHTQNRRKKHEQSL